MSYPHVVPFRKITIIGVGLLGGSLGLAIRKRKLAKEVTGFVRRAASVAECRRLGAVHNATRNLREAVTGADLIVLCTPLAQMPSLVHQMLPAVKRGAIVTDVGSVKASVVRGIEAPILKAGAHFVASHPMAGAEKTGVAASRADLFANAVCVVSPTRNSNPVSLRRVQRFWEDVGCRVLRLPPEIHDSLVSRSSHLPHIVAATLANMVLDPSGPKNQAALCANGFRDATRIASGSPEMWRDIAVANRRNLDRAIRKFIAGLEKFRSSLQRGDVRAISRHLENAKSRRDTWRARCASPSPE